MANGHGGARPGSGRKPRAERFAGQIAAAEKQVVDRLPYLIGNLMQLADGVSVEEEDENSDDGTRVYTKPPCFKSNAYLIDRVLGKATQAVEVSGKDGQPVEVVQFYLPSNGRDARPTDPDDQAQ